MLDLILEKGCVNVASCKIGSPFFRPVPYTMFNSENNSRTPANRFVLFFADFAIAEILPLLNEKNVMMRS